jgi:predicted amidohydrolase
VERVTVASVQQRMRLYDTVADYRADLQRFLRIAQAKQAQLVVFPELAGMLVAPPMLRDVRSRLLIAADRGRRKEATLWQRVYGALASRSAGWLGADLRNSLQALISVSGAELWTLYANLFSELAREFQVTLIAPSAYLPDPTDQMVRNLTVVFGSDGSLLGHQAKVILHPEDEGLAQPGDTWLPVATPVGTLGLMIGGDVLYPEVGRLLAYQGAEALLLLGSCSHSVLYQKLRAGALARMQENQLFGLVSFVVGPHELGRHHEPLIGKSAIFAPQELTPRYNGVLVEMGSQRSEGILTAEWDFVALRRLWEVSETPTRLQLPLARIYERLKNLPRVHSPALLTQPGPDASQTAGLLAAADAPLNLEDLPVISAVTRRWSSRDPLQSEVDAPLDLSELPEALAYSPAGPTGSSSNPTEMGSATAGADDETDEMDALPDNVTDKSATT